MKYYVKALTSLVYSRIIDWTY